MARAAELPFPFGENERNRRRLGDSKPRSIGLHLRGARREKKDGKKDGKEKGAYGAMQAREHSTAQQ
jgi:hypothetical protein